MKKHEITMTADKPTKNTVRYAADNDKPSPCRTLYVERWALGDPPPQRIKVTIEEV